MSKIIQYAGLSSGDTIPFSIEEGGDLYVDQDTDIEEIKKEIDLNYTQSSFRILVLYPDETINYEIPAENIKLGGSYNENYQDGQRRSLSFTLYNEDGNYNPNIDTLWAGTRIRFDVGLKYGEQTIWFRKGIFIISKASPSFTPTGKEIAITASDKFSLFENSTGKIEEGWEVDAGIDIEEIIQSIQLTQMGNGDIFDPSPLIYHSSLKGKKTQIAISKSAGETYGSILLELATQLSAEIFYNANGNLVLSPTSVVANDGDKPLLYYFNADQGDMSQLNFDYDYNSIVNRVVVIGNSSSGGVYKAIAVNNDERSPLCYQRIGFRTGNVINDSNIYSDILAEERAEYELRQQLILKTTTSSNILFNPFLSVNNLIAITSDVYNLAYERFLIQGLSFSLDYSGQMSVTFTNLNNILTDIEIVSNITPKAVNKNIVLDGIVYPVYLEGGQNSITMEAIFLHGLGMSENNNATQDLSLSGTEFQEGHNIYVYAIVESKYFQPQPVNWTRIENSADPVGYERYRIKLTKALNKVDNITDDGAVVCDGGLNGNGVTVYGISAVQPDTTFTLENDGPDDNVDYIFYSINGGSEERYTGSPVTIKTKTPYTYRVVPKPYCYVDYAYHPDLPQIDSNANKTSFKCNRAAEYVTFSLGSGVISARINYQTVEDGVVVSATEDVSGETTLLVAKGSQASITPTASEYYIYQSFTVYGLGVSTFSYTISLQKKTRAQIKFYPGVGVDSITISYKDYDYEYDKTITITDETTIYTYLTAYYDTSMSASSGFIIPSSEYGHKQASSVSDEVKPKTTGYHAVADLDIKMSGEDSVELSEANEGISIRSGMAVQKDVTTRISGYFYSNSKESHNYGTYWQYTYPVSLKDEYGHDYVEIFLTGSDPSLSLDSNISFGPAKYEFGNSEGGYSKYESKLGATSKTTLKCYAKNGWFDWFSHDCYVVGTMYQNITVYEPKS